MESIETASLKSLIARSKSCLARKRRPLLTKASAYFGSGEEQDRFTEDGWFKTGDLVTQSADGFLYFKDRDKDALKVGGENVSAKEVEDVCRTVAGIADVAVVGQKHDFLGQQAIAFVIAAPNAPADLGDQIMKACAARLAGFKCPKAVYLVDEFPRATLEKVAKNVLREVADAKPPV